MLRVVANSLTQLFFVGMYWRIAYGFLRIIFGVALLKVVGTPLLSVIHDFMSHELIEDKTDILYAAVSRLLEGHDFSVTYFLASYFIFWGVVDIFLSYNLIKERLWAFPISMAVILLFISYGIVRFTFTHSLVLLYVIIFDITILYLIKKEYERIKPKPAEVHTL